MSQLPTNPSSNPTYGLSSFPGRRSAGQGPTYDDIAGVVTQMLPGVRNGQFLVPPGSTPFSPGTGSTIGDVIGRSFGNPSLSQASYSINNTNSNSYTPYARVAREYNDKNLSTKLLHTGMVISTFRDKKTTAIASRHKYDFSVHGRARGKRILSRKLSNRHVMFDPVRLNFLLACTEPKAFIVNQQWTVEDVMEKWNLAEGIVLNQEGGPSRDGKVHDKSREMLLNMIIHGRVEGVLNVWGEHLETDSSLYFILKRCPLKIKNMPHMTDGGFVLDPSLRSRGYAGRYVSRMGINPIASKGVTIKAKENLEKARLTPVPATKDLALTQNPWQLCPFHPTPEHPTPDIFDTYGMDDFGTSTRGAIIRVGRVWFPGSAPRTSTFVRHLEPMRNLGDYLSCGVITVIQDNHNDIFRRS